MSDLQLFNNNEFGEIRTVLIKDKPYVVAIDVARALGYKNPNDAVTRHCKGYVKHAVPTNSGKQQMNVIPEGDIYRLVANSKLPSAEKFESWIFDEVLPSIRKHGMYAKDELLDNPDLLLDVIKKYKAEREEKLQLQKQVELDRPKVLFADAWEVSENSILVGEMAKLLVRNGLEDLGQNRFFKWLRSNGYLHKTGEQYNLPTQRSIDLEIFEVKTRTIANSDGSVRVTKTSKVTVKGQMYFLNKFKEKIA